jgi:hypothetical protein
MEGISTLFGLGRALHVVSGRAAHGTMEATCSARPERQVHALSGAASKAIECRTPARTNSLLSSESMLFELRHTSESAVVVNVHP